MKLYPIKLEFEWWCNDEKVGGVAYPNNPKRTQVWGTDQSLLSKTRTGQTSGTYNTISEDNFFSNLGMWIPGTNHHHNYIVENSRLFPHDFEQFQCMIWLETGEESLDSCNLTWTDLRLKRIYLFFWMTQCSFNKDMRSSYSHWHSKKKMVAYDRRMMEVEENKVYKINYKNSSGYWCGF